MKFRQMFERRADVVAAGVISFGAVRTEAWCRGGNYVGQILKGAKPADMPIIQTTRLELSVNLPIAQSHDSAKPARAADEVIR